MCSYSCGGEGPSVGLPDISFSSVCFDPSAFPLKGNVQAIPCIQTPNTILKIWRLLLSNSELGYAVLWPCLHFEHTHASSIC